MQILGSPAHSTLLFFWLFGLVWEKPLVTPTPSTPKQKQNGEKVDFLPNPIWGLLRPDPPKSGLAQKWPLVEAGRGIICSPLLPWKNRGLVDLGAKIGSRLALPWTGKVFGGGTNVESSPQQGLDLDWERPDPESKRRRNMEDWKALKQKAWHLTMKETVTQEPTLGKNGIQSHTWWVPGITMVWSRHWATKTGMC